MIFISFIIKHVELLTSDVNVYYDKEFLLSR